jgi:L-alanine-DL-glutamate epimerase-like enolase superfamily enzyme
MLKITNVSSLVYRQALKLNGPAPKFSGESRASFETMLVKVETDAGLTGWGEAFAHRVWPATKIALENLVAPLCIGADATRIAPLMESVLRRNYAGGRTGPVMYAISGLDIALWDLMGKAAGMPLHRLLGGTRHASVPAYASLLRYGDADVVERSAEAAVARGYRDLKIHEVGLAEIRAANAVARRHGCGPLMVDVNAPWTLQEVLAQAVPLRELGLKWVEEPVWPPEDYGALALVRQAGLPVAVGESATSIHDFGRIIADRAADFIQPSVTKIGGVSVMREVFALANHSSVAVSPHSSYFGPGLLATVHLCAALAREPLVERLFCDLSDGPFGTWDVPQAGHLTLPQGPGLGLEPDPQTLEQCRIA